MLIVSKEAIMVLEKSAFSHQYIRRDLHSTAVASASHGCKEFIYALCLKGMETESRKLRESSI